MYITRYWSSCTLPAIGLHVHYPLLAFMYITRYSCPILTKLEFSRHIFEKHSDIKSNENPSSGSRVVPCGQTDGHYESIVAFRNFTTASKRGGGGEQSVGRKAK
jgi:hypothetical protein